MKNTLLVGDFKNDKFSPITVLKNLFDESSQSQLGWLSAGSFIHIKKYFQTFFFGKNFF